MKQNVINFYENTRQYYLSYHNHKELSAWAGLALKGLISSFIIAAPTNGLPTNINNQLIINIGLASSELIIFSLLLMYVMNQLRMKKFAGDLTGAATHILSEIILQHEHSFNALKYLRTSKNIHESNSQISYTIPEYLLNKSKILSTKGSGFHNITRFTIILIFIFTTITVLFYRLYPLCK